MGVRRKKEHTFRPITPRQAIEGIAVGIGTCAYTPASIYSKGSVLFCSVPFRFVSFQYYVKLRVGFRLRVSKVGD